MLPKWHTRYLHAKYAIEALGNVRGRILDVGAGQGGITTALAKLLPRLIFFACDNNTKQLKIFKKNNAISNVKINCTLCDAYNLAYRNDYFGAVTMFDVLEHLGNPEKSILEVDRVLRKRGVFHLVVPCEADIWTIDGLVKNIFKVNLKKEPIGHIQQFKSVNLRKMLKNYNFRVVTTKYSYHFIYQLLSFGYFIYLYLFNKRKYLPLTSKIRPAGSIIKPLSMIFGFLANLESTLMAKIPGQTMHITAVKL